MEDQRDTERVGDHEDSRGCQIFGTEEEESHWGFDWVHSWMLHFVMFVLCVSCDCVAMEEEEDAETCSVRIEGLVTIAREFI